MCIYALYRYRNCNLRHPLGKYPRGGRAFRIRPYQLNGLANDELKNTSESKNRIYDHALPCEGEEYRVYCVNQICHVCNRRLALATGYPLNRDYRLPVTQVLEWHMPYSQMTCNGLFRKISYTNPKQDVDEEQPVNPNETSYNTPETGTDMYNPLSTNAGLPIMPGDNDRAEDTSVQDSAAGMEARQRALSTESDNSTLSQNELRPCGLEVRPAQQSPHRTASLSPSKYRVRVTSPVPFNMHPGDTLFENY